MTMKSSDKAVVTKRIKRAADCAARLTAAVATLEKLLADVEPAGLALYEAALHPRHLSAVRCLLQDELAETRKRTEAAVADHKRLLAIYQTE